VRVHAKARSPGCAPRRKMDRNERHHPIGCHLESCVYEIRFRKRTLHSAGTYTLCNRPCSPLPSCLLQVDLLESVN